MSSKSAHLKKNLKKQADVNVTSMMDILSVLIFFLLGAYVVAVTFIDVPIPKVPDSTAEESKAKSLQEHFALMIKIYQDGCQMSGSGVPGLPMRFPKVEGKHDLERIQKKLIEVKGLFAKEKEITILPDNAVSYREIIEIIDVARSEWTWVNGVGKLDYKFNELFPVVIMAGIDE